MPTSTAMTLLSDPSELGWPAGLPLELALKQAPVKDVCEAHGVSREHYLRLRQDPNFQAAVQSSIDLLAKEGMSFKVKAQAQSEALLATSWQLIHAPLEDVPASVKADLIKFTVRVAGLDASIDQKVTADKTNGNNFQININLG